MSVDDATVTIGTPYFSAIGAAASVRFDEYGLIRKSTLSCVISFSYSAFTLPASDPSSYTTSWIGRPSSAPRSLTSSAHIFMPLRCRTPKSASDPVSDVVTPILIGTLLCGSALTGGFVGCGAAHACSNHSNASPSRVVSKRDRESGSMFMASVFLDVELALRRPDQTHEFVFERRPGLVVLERRGRTRVQHEQRVVQVRVALVDIVELQRIDQGEDLCVDGLAARVARERRAEQRQHQIWTGRHAPTAQRLPEIFVMLRNTHRRRRIEQPRNSDGGVHQQASGRLQCGSAVELKHLVDDGLDVVEVREEVADALAHETRQDEVVGTDRGIQEVFVRVRVEPVDRSVNAIPRIVDLEGCVGVIDHHAVALVIRLRQRLSGLFRWRGTAAAA